MKKNQKDLNLLPAKFKFVGLFGIVLGLFSMAFTPSMGFDNAFLLSKIILLISLLIIALSKNKIEDELTIKIRLKAFAFAFIAVVAFAIVDIIIDLVFNGEFKESKTGLATLIQMFLYYFIAFYIMKRKM